MRGTLRSDSATPAATEESYILHNIFISEQHTFESEVNTMYARNYLVLAVIGGHIVINRTHVHWKA